MKQYKKERAIACIRLAIELAGDGSMSPFTDEEHNLMNQLLEELTIVNDEYYCS